LWQESKALHGGKYDKAAKKKVAACLHQVDGRRGRLGTRQSMKISCHIAQQRRGKHEGMVEAAAGKILLLVAWQEVLHGCKRDRAAEEVEAA
jgi:hypothetical protein